MQRNEGGTAVNTQPREMTPDERLKIARDIGKLITERCEKLGCSSAEEASEVLMLVLQANTSTHFLRELFGGA